MRHARKDVLAHAGFPHDENRRVRHGIALQFRGDFLHGMAGKGRFQIAALRLGHKGQLVIDFLNLAALFACLLIELRKARFIAHVGDDKADVALFVKDRDAGDDDVLAVLELLHVGGGLAGADDFGIEGAVKDAFIHQFAHVLAAQFRFAHAGELGIHAVDVQRGARGVRDENAVGNRVEDRGKIFVDINHVTLLGRWKGKMGHGNRLAGASSEAAAEGACLLSAARMGSAKDRAERGGGKNARYGRAHPADFLCNKGGLPDTERQSPHQRGICTRSPSVATAILRSAENFLSSSVTSPMGGTLSRKMYFCVPSR